MDSFHYNVMWYDQYMRFKRLKEEMRRKKEVFGSAMGLAASPCCRAGDFVFISGQVPTDEKGAIVGNDIYEQTELVLTKIRELLGRAHSSISDVVRTTVFLTNMKEYRGMNSVYERYFPKEPPTRLCVQVPALAIEVKVEIEAIAYSPLKGLKRLKRWFL